jgi:hypothetical protein
LHKSREFCSRKKKINKGRGRKKYFESSKTKPINRKQLDDTLGKENLGH